MQLPGALVQKDPDALNVPQGLDWTQYLAAIDAAETITTSTWAASPSGLTFSSASIVSGNLKTQVRISGGVAGTEYTVTNHIITSSGVQDDRSFPLVVGQL